MEYLATAGRVGATSRFSTILPKEFAGIFARVTYLEKIRRSAPHSLFQSVYLRFGSKTKRDDDTEDLSIKKSRSRLQRPFVLRAPRDLRNMPNDVFLVVGR